MTDTCKKANKQSRCPYCDEEIIKAKLPFCAACHVTLNYCPDCQSPVTSDAKKCPKCGTTLKAK